MAHVFKSRFFVALCQLPVASAPWGRDIDAIIELWYSTLCDKYRIHGRPQSLEALKAKANVIIQRNHFKDAWHITQYLEAVMLSEMPAVEIHIPLTQDAILELNHGTPGTAPVTAFNNQDREFALMQQGYGNQAPPRPSVPFPRAPPVPVYQPPAPSQYDIRGPINIDLSKARDDDSDSDEPTPRTRTTRGSTVSSRHTVPSQSLTSSYRDSQSSGSRHSKSTSARSYSKRSDSFY